MASRLVIPSPAKINLFLNVLGRRADGYHEIETLLSRIRLFDTVILDFDQPRISVECAHPGVPNDSTNLAFQAASLFLNALSTKDGVAIFIDKVIPVAAGLGGGSSNAAAVLMGLNDHYGFPFRDQELVDMARGIGADVPFFLLRHAALGRGIGDELDPYNELPPRKVVLVCPPFEVSTAWAYKKLNLALTISEKKFKIRRLKQDYPCLTSFLSNDLEQVSIGKFPEIQTIKTALLDCGADIALMSGSGPSVFGLFEDPLQATAASRNMWHRGRWTTFLTELLLP